jgi:hypothetical protein
MTLGAHNTCVRQCSLEAKPHELCCLVQAKRLRMSVAPKRSALLSDAKPSADAVTAATRQLAAAIDQSVARALPLLRFCLPMSATQESAFVAEWCAVTACAICLRMGHSSSCLLTLAVNACLVVVCALSLQCLLDVPALTSRMLCSPALARMLTVVDLDEHSLSVEYVACQHMLAREAQHVLQPWHADASWASVEPVAAARTASELLARTAGGTASGLSFVGAVGPDLVATVRAFLRSRLAGIRLRYNPICETLSSCLGCQIGAALT